MVHRPVVGMGFGKAVLSLFYEVAKTQGMRELLVARIFGDVAHMGKRAQVKHDGELMVTIWLPRRSRWALGLQHAALWLKLRRLCRAEMGRLKIWAPLRVRVLTDAG